MCQGALPSILRGTLNSVSVARLADQCQCLTHQYWFLTSTVTLICHHSAEQSAFSRADKASTLLFALLSDNFGDWSIVDTDSLLEKTLFNMHSEKYIEKVCNYFANPRALYHASPFSVADMSSRNDINLLYFRTDCMLEILIVHRVGQSGRRDVESVAWNSVNQDKRFANSCFKW